MTTERIVIGDAVWLVNRLREADKVLHVRIVAGPVGDRDAIIALAEALVAPRRDTHVNFITNNTPLH